MKSSRTIQSPDKIPATQKLSLLENEIQAWLNGNYLNKVLLSIADRIQDRQTQQSLVEELKKSGDVIEAMTSEYKKIGGQKTLTEVPAEVRRVILERELLQRSNESYLLEIRVQAATRVANKQLEENSTVALERTIGFVDGLKRELGRVRTEIQKGSKSG